MKMKNLLLTIAATLGMTASTIAQNVPNYIPTNGLVGWWPFNGNANDESGNGNNGTVNGATLTADRFNLNNNAYFFNGTSTNQEFIISNNPISNDDLFTISLWINRADTLNNRWSLMISDNNNFTGSYEILSYLDTIYFRNWAVGLNFDLKTIVNISNNQYFNITVTSNLNSSKLYINGLLSEQTSISKIKPIGGNLFIGKHANFPPSSNTSFNGKIDDIGIWNRVLTQQEITALYTGVPTSNNGGGNTAAATVPAAISYQAIARNTQGHTLSDTDIQVKFTLLADSLTGAAEYSESHSLATNSLGLFTTAFGAGTAETGTFAGINWASGSKYLKVELDAGDGFVDMGTQQLLSVPFSMRSNTSAKAGTIENSGLPVYADNAAALAGGLVAGQMYRTATGDLMIVY